MRIRISSVILFFLAMAIILFFLPIDSSEGGPLELAQDALLVLALIIWATVTVKSYRDRPNQPFDAIFALFFSVLVYVVLGRELTWLKVAGVAPEIAKKIELTSIVIVLAFLAFMLWQWVFRTKDRKLKLVSFFKSRCFSYAVVSLVFVLIGDFFEKDFFATPKHQLFEEMAELTGYVFILLAAISPLKIIMSRQKT